MMYTVGDFYDALDQIAPFATAETWDNVGLLVGSRTLPAKRVLLALDLTDAVLTEAERLQVDLVITHHPLIFAKLHSLRAEGLPYRAVRAGISVVSAHTNLDKAVGGVNDALAERLGLENIRPLGSSGVPPLPLGRIGELTTPQSPSALAALVKERLGAAGVRYVPGSGEITTVAVGGGSNGELLGPAIAAGAQALVTAEVKHHLFLEAAEQGFTLIDAGHFATENPVVSPLRDRLLALLPGADIALSRDCTDGVRYL